MAESEIFDYDELVTRAIGLLGDHRRIIIGLTGSPGSGKTTIAKQLVALINERLDPAADGSAAATYLPMDGYHLANSTLDALGNHDRKGAIDTFDGWGFVALLRRVMTERGHAVYAPSFERSVDEGVAGAVQIAASTSIVIAEGNYLLVDEEPWKGISALLAEVWFCETPEDERLSRLINRHTRHGRSQSAAEAWARTVDGANSRIIEPTRERADLIISGAA